MVLLSDRISVRRHGTPAILVSGQLDASVSQFIPHLGHIFCVLQSTLPVQSRFGTVSKFLTHGLTWRSLTYKLDMTRPIYLALWNMNTERLERTKIYPVLHWVWHTEWHPVTRPDLPGITEPLTPRPKDPFPARFWVISARQHAERAICYRKSVCLSVCHTGGSVKNGWTYHRNSFTIW